MEMDHNSNGIIEPLEMGLQEWSEGRLIWFDCHETQCGIISDIPPDLGNLTHLEYLGFQYYICF